MSFLVPSYNANVRTLIREDNLELQITYKHEEITTCNKWNKYWNNTQITMCNKMKEIWKQY